MSSWIGKKYDWDNETTPPTIEQSHYLKCSECGYLHPIYLYSVWTNRLTLASVYSEKVEIPKYCARCGALNHPTEKVGEEK